MTEVSFKKQVCGGYCKKAKMGYLLNVWDGLDHNGNQVDNVVGTQGAVYVDGRLDAKVRL